MPREPYTKNSADNDAIILFAHSPACRALAEADDDLATLISEVGEVTLEIDGDGFLALARAIVDQQISGRAAKSIWARTEQLCGGQVTPDAILAHDSEELRACGLSYRKADYLTDLAQHTADGRLDFDHLATLDDEAIIAALTEIKGIGRWTAQMFLIFSLARPDVFALDDGGLRRAVARLKGIDPDAPKALIEAISEDWSPHRTAAALYLWKGLNNAS